MSEQPRDDNPTWNEAEPVPAGVRFPADGLHTGNGNSNGRKRKSDAHPVPGINLRELWDERNWTALAGLALLAIGVLALIDNLLGIDLSLGSLLLLGAGGYVMRAAWLDYEADGRQWVGNTRNRLAAGALIALVGLMTLFEIHLGGLLLLGAGGWLAYDGWQAYQANGQTWPEPARSRAMVGGGLLLLGALLVLNLGSPVPLVLIGIGVVLYLNHRRAA